MSSGYEEFWATLPEKVLHPVRVPVVEALRWIGEPLTSVDLVDVLDGLLSMWEAGHHLQALEELDVVEPVSDAWEGKRGLLDVPYRLKGKRENGG